MRDRSASVGDAASASEGALATLARIAAIRHFTCGPPYRPPAAPSFETAIPPLGLEPIIHVGVNAEREERFSWHGFQPLPGDTIQTRLGSHGATRPFKALFGNPCRQRPAQHAGLIASMYRESTARSGESNSKAGLPPSPHRSLVISAKPTSSSITFRV